ncbi:MAG: sigma 54-interacting transcriptional regulator, partial [Firmicutes bacterium]|nr:sigma 54-interacting transcriptional regulator [Bacillota bacterium]
KLLRVLETGEILRLGGEKSIQTDVRIIAATNMDLDEAVRDRQFRKDLFYRLDVVRLELPPLRERKEDIPALVHLFITHNKIGADNDMRISSRAMQALVDYHWPGNIRELLNIVDQSLALCEGGVILPAHLPEKIINNTVGEERPAGGQSIPQTAVELLEHLLKDAGLQESLNKDNIMQALQMTRQLQEMLLKKMRHLGVRYPGPPSLEEMEKQTVTRALEYYEGNISTAARSLGIGRNTLYRKIKEYGLG